MNSGKISLLKSMRTSQLMGRLRSNGYAKKTRHLPADHRQLNPKRAEERLWPGEGAGDHPRTCKAARGSDITTITRRVRFIQNGWLSPSLTIVPIVHVLLDLILLITVTPWYFTFDGGDHEIASHLAGDTGIRHGPPGDDLAVAGIEHETGSGRPRDSWHTARDDQSTIGYSSAAR